jgi:hypothetical protein
VPAIAGLILFAGVAAGEIRHKLACAIRYWAKPAKSWRGVLRDRNGGLDRIGADGRPPMWPHSGSGDPNSTPVHHGLFTWE